MTRVLQGASTEEISAAITAVQVETEKIPESEDFAPALRRSFIDEVDWKTLADEAVVAHGEFDYVKAQTLMAGAILKSPPGQSLYLQVRSMGPTGRLLFGRIRACTAQSLLPFLSNTLKPGPPGLITHSVLGPSVYLAPV